MEAASCFVQEIVKEDTGLCPNTEDFVLGMEEVS
jgi:hypothetical protein